MAKRSFFPLIYGLISAVIAFIAAYFIAQKTFNWPPAAAVLIASVFALFFFALSWFRGHASVEIKRITRELHLTDADLARITGLKKSDFPIYHDKLQLILPKRYWPKVLDALQKYEQQQKQF